MNLGLSGTVSADSAAKVGQLTGAKVLVTGRVFKAEGNCSWSPKSSARKPAAFMANWSKGGAKASISDLSADLAKKIAADVTQKGDTLVAKVETRDELIAKIKKQLDGQALPSVSVKIGEQHFGQRVIDPAAETELGSILQACGFKLVDANSTNRADVEITGDAFSAYGMRKGNLISCKSRVEVKAHKKNGDVITVDRQTSVARGHCRANRRQDRAAKCRGGNGRAVVAETGAVILAAGTSSAVSPSS